MDDLRLVGARRMIWDEEAWRVPASIAFHIRNLNQILADDDESPESRAEAKMLIPKLHALVKRPPLI